jgi:membrane-associated protein
MILLLCIAAISGDQTGYLIGRKVGTPLFNRPNSRLFKREHLERTQAFYDKHGPKTIVLARFVPIVRTFAPTIAGVANMRYSTFRDVQRAGRHRLDYFDVLARILPGQHADREGQL